MKIADLINTNEAVVPPFSSISSVQDLLIEHWYLVVKNENEFMGILTLEDVLANGHNLVIDCLSEKQSFDKDEEAGMVLQRMIENRLSAAPVFTGGNEYIGSILTSTLLSKMWEISKQNVTINFANAFVPGNNDKKFLAELFHNTRNPIQVIISAADMLKEDTDTIERKMLFKAIENNARILNEIIEKLYTAHCLASPISGNFVQ